LAARGIDLRGRQKVPKDVKLSVLNIVEATPLKKNHLLQKLGMTPVKYFRWSQKYYLDNCLEDKRGGLRSKRPYLADLYRKQIIDIRKQKFLGTADIGPERIMDALEQDGIFLSHETIRKVLHQEGLITPRPRVEIHEFKRFEAEAKNDLWQMDFLYLFVVGYGYFYLCSVLDDYSRKIVHAQLSTSATAQEAADTLKTAIEKAGIAPKRVLTDRGVQFFTGVGNRIGKFETFLKTNHIEHVLARVRHPQTLGKIERYHRSLRQECLNHFVFDDPIETRRIVREYIHLYNTVRKHKGIGRVTPEQRYSGQDKHLKTFRLQLRNKILLEQKARLSEPALQQEMALQETVSFLKNALSKEVVLV
jgi:transposase InsO family protein